MAEERLTLPPQPKLSDFFLKDYPNTSTNAYFIALAHWERVCKETLLRKQPRTYCDDGCSVSRGCNKP